MFPGATEGQSPGAYAIVGAPLDVSASFHPGARFGPDRIRHFARGFEDFDHRTDQHFSDLAVVDHGDVRPWGNVTDYLDFLAGELGDLVETGTVPILLGGEHTVTVAGVRATEPAVFVCLDAHLDLRESYDGYEMSHATVTHHVLEDVDKAYVLGARAGSKEEWRRVDRSDTVTAVPPDRVQAWVADAFETAVGGRSVYLSIDVDVLDPAFAPATGTKEPIGLSPQTARTVIRSIAPTVVGADVVEVTDRDHGQTPTLAGKLVRELVYSHAAHQ